MRSPIMRGAPSAYIEGTYPGHNTSPGSYTLTIKYANSESKAEFKILPNPLYSVTSEQYDEYHLFMKGMENNLNEMHDKVNAILKMRNQIESLLNDLPSDAKYTTIKNDGESLTRKMKEWDDDMIQRKSKAYDDVDNFENKFTADYLFLINQAESEIPRVTKPCKDLLVEYNKKWSHLKAIADEIINTDVPRYTKQLWDEGIGAITNFSK
jgi:hypothetical protein